MNINRCCREPEQDFPEGHVDQRVTDFLSGLTKKKINMTVLSPGLIYCSVRMMINVIMVMYYISGK